MAVFLHEAVEHSVIGPDPTKWALGNEFARVFLWTLVDDSNFELEGGYMQHQQRNTVWLDRSQRTQK